MLVGALAAFLTRNSMDVYATLERPALAPPGWLFPIVWTILYILMGISSAAVYLKSDKNKSGAECGLRYYLISLVFNFGWSIIFFNYERFLLSFIWLLFLLYYIVRTVICYGRVSRPASLIEIPYILWVSFAGYLNLAIWYLN